MKSLQELDGDLINHWYIACLSSELPPDEVIERTVYEVPYALYRNKDGKAVVMVDRCIHRGAQLSKGTCQKGHLRCPYHGWQFGHDGMVTEIPSEGDQNKTHGYRGDVVPTVERDGVIWIWPGKMDRVTSAPAWSFPHYGLRDWAQYFMVTDFSNEVTHLAQNFMDVPHTVFVHSKWFRNRRLIKVPIRIDVAAGHVKVTYEQPEDVIGFMERILNPQKKPMLHTDEYVFPQVTRVDYSFGKNHFIINSQCTPVGRHQTRVYTWICYRIGFLSRILLPFMKFYTRKVITQDVEIMENHGKNLKKFESFFVEHQYKNTQADELHLAIDKMRSQGAQDRDLPGKMSYSREREFWI